MRGYQLTAIVEREGDLFVAHCVELQVASLGSSGAAALSNLKDAVMSRIENEREAAILERRKREVRVARFEVERGP